MPYELKKQRTLLLPGAEPRTAIVYEPMTEETYALFEAAVARHNSSMRQTGRDPMDGDSVRRVCALEREALAQAVLRIEHDTVLEEKAAIAGFLADLATQVYRQVKVAILDANALTEIEVKL